MINKKDFLIFIGVFFLAVLIRLPLVSHPPESVFDEQYWRITISNVHNGNPFFDVHPPLSTFLWEKVVYQKYFASTAHGGAKINVSFGDFPYYNLRFFTAIIGSLLPAILFLISRLLAVESSLAILPALFVIFDNALIIYSRTILPDIILLFFGFFGVMLWLCSQQIKSRVSGVLLLLLASVSFGAGVSTKWTGLGFLGIILLYEAYYKNIKRIIFCITCASTVYVLVFAIFFLRLTGNHIESVYKVNALNSVHFSAEKNIKNFSQFFIQYHRAMLQANNSYDSHFEGLKHPSASKPYQWPFNQKIMNFWVNQNNTAGIVLAGNFPAWIIGIISVFSLFILILLQWLGYSIPITFPQSTYFLLGGFFVSYVPLFFISRSLFIYHYFPALVFSYLLIPSALSFWVTVLPSTVAMKRLVKIFVIAVMAWYIVFIPRIYGIPSPLSAMQNNIKFDTMAKTQSQ